MQLLGGTRRAGHGAYGEPDQARHRPAVEEGVQDRVPETALGVVVLDGEQTAGVLGGLAQGLDVDGLDRVQVDHPHLDALAIQHVGGGQRLLHGHPGGHDGQPVPAGEPQHLAAADRELVVGAVDDRGVAA